MILFTMQVTSIFKLTKSLIIHSDKKNSSLKSSVFSYKSSCSKSGILIFATRVECCWNTALSFLILSFISGGPVFLLPTLVRGEGEGEMF